MATLQEAEAQILRIESQIVAAQKHLSGLQRELEDARRHATAARELDAAYRGGMPDEWQRETLSVLDHLQPTRILTPSDTSISDATSPGHKQWPLSPEEYKRYGRQLIMPEIGLEGQLRLKTARVLIVGAGGLGCPAAAYLAGAGVGTLGLIDGDTVEASNLHRQIAHSTSRVGWTKVSSAISYLRDLNPLVKYVGHETHLEPSTALDMFKQYDLVLDCTDHPTSRYLISDACVLAGKPLVSASALRTEGQLIVLNNPPRQPGDETGGPCYRCVFPVPPPPDTLTSCSEGGILGPVVGTMGVLQSLEAIKLLTTPPPASAPRPVLQLFTPHSSTPFRSIRMRSRRRDCAACGASPSISSESMSAGLMDYVAFCGAVSIPRLDDASRIAPEQLVDARRDGEVVVVDVRPAVEHGICNLEGSMNIPFTELGAVLKQSEHEQRPAWLDAKDVVIVCRLGNDSQRAVGAIKASGLARGNVVDVRGGFKAWREEVDREWPDY